MKQRAFTYFVVSGGYWYNTIQPYIKNYNVFLCPDRTDTTTSKSNPAQEEGGGSYEDIYSPLNTVAVRCSGNTGTPERLLRHARGPDRHR
jgi:hypothetical protein